MFLNFKRNALVVGAIVGAVGLGGGVAIAASTSGGQPASSTVYACVNNTGQIGWLELSQPGHKCAENLHLWHWSVAGQQGAPGAQGPSGVVATHTTDLGSVTSVPTGGSFVTNATKAGTISLPAGTYLINLNAKATPPTAGTGTAEVFPQFFVYNQPANASFTGDLFNVGSGPLESGANSQIDSYYSGSSVVTLTQATTIYVYAFGYDSDRGAGSYALDDLSVTATQIQPAS